ncbi:hypothetical protein Mp_3g04600 [Marchantia polymorpha subsp. ruderalis]|uniref:Uncharacterized protein n=2 Tax=Marchantia polymorpha TaxID=3197 RepID=A0AAF6AXF3_MARPO|nr:hypothetical protein MARPO_0022s0068 [Marchantia polymorpha]BBN04437.1 hypothetical protein Mp_3g04600 [Marchantia polymorpha subsp. ruderalis]|eukprot:PTQ43964.1 hypothetical protein MARPO_0022s0068 [Marchantia polymorpha]
MQAGECVPASLECHAGVIRYRSLDRTPVGEKGPSSGYHRAEWSERASERERLGASGPPVDRPALRPSLRRSAGLRAGSRSSVGAGAGAGAASFLVAPIAWAGADLYPIRSVINGGVS